VIVRGERCLVVGGECLPFHYNLHFTAELGGCLVASVFLFGGQLLRTVPVSVYSQFSVQIALPPRHTSLSLLEVASTMSSEEQVLPNLTSPDPPHEQVIPRKRRAMEEPMEESDIVTQDGNVPVSGLQ